MIDPLIILIAAVFLLAGFVKGVIGLGLPTIAVGLLTLVMAPAHAAALLIVPSTVTNLWQLAAGPSFDDRTSLTTTALPTIAASTPRR